MKFTRKNEPTSFNDIGKFESTLGIRLPKSYVDFLVIYNGGVPSPENRYFDLPGWNDLVVKVFLGITREPETSLLSDHFSNFSDMIERHMLPIAYDPFSQEVTMDLRTKTYGKIYVRSHVHPPQGPLLIDDTGFTPDDYEEAQLFVPVADSFEAFIAMLGPDPE
jgi:hypothetical protein